MTSTTGRAARAVSNDAPGAPPGRQAPGRAPGRWAAVSGWMAALWAAAYGSVALVWTAIGRGYPFGENDPGAAGPLGELPADVGAPLFAGVLLATAVLALGIAGRHAARLRGPARWPLLGFGWAVVAALLVVVPDERLLTLAGYAPMLILGAPFGWPPVEYGEVLTWQLLNQVWCLAGGVLLARALLTWQFRSAGACTACGRAHQADGAHHTDAHPASGARLAGWATPTAAGRWGRRAAYAAAVVPVLYAVTRFAWLAGIPLGISEEFLRTLQDTGLVWAGGGLGAFAVVGAVLTLGLFQRWGEAFPRWMLGLSGRRVPVPLAVVPAALVSLMVASASLGMLSDTRILEMALSGEATALPMLLWPLWAVALGAATLAYYLRRRGRCGACGRA